MIPYVFAKQAAPTIASIANLHGCVPQSQIDGAIAVSEIFRRAGIRHALAGGLAVGCNGYLRNTDSIDFVVDESVFVLRDKILYVRDDLPIKYLGTNVSWILLDTAEKPIFDKFLQMPTSVGEVPVMPIEPLIAMKLIAGRHKDRTDIIELVKLCSNLSSIVEFVTSNNPQLLPLLSELIVCAAEEK
jgi:hypothetical protein